MTKGAMIYIPKELLEELEELKQKMSLKNNDALKTIARDSRIGREIRMTIDINMNRKRRK